MVDHKKVRAKHASSCIDAEMIGCEPRHYRTCRQARAALRIQQQSAAGGENQQSFHHMAALFRAVQAHTLGELVNPIATKP